MPGPYTAGVSYRLEPVTRFSLAGAPPVCHECVFWQSRSDRAASKDRWAEKVEDDWGPWGTLYRAEDDRLLGFLQYGPAPAFPRARELPAGPPSQDAVLVTCAYLVDPSSPWVMQSLFLSVIGEARDRKVRAIETFGYRYPEGTSPPERFLVHRTVFPSDFLGDFGFVTVRSSGRVELLRLDIRGVIPVEEEGVGRELLRRAKELLAPPPLPERPV
jgi:hypothetical protein